jgi:glycosyltransferase involved in cell wall biosynthesis
MPVDASVIMPTFNKAEYLNLTLASYMSQQSSDYQLIIIDDGSVDDTEKVVEKYYGKLNIEYIRQDHGGAAKARNAGIRKAEGRILIFSDDDRLVDPVFISEHINALNHGDGKDVIIGWKRRALTIWKKDKLPIREQDLLAIIKRQPDLISAFDQHTDLRLIQAPELEVRLDEGISRVDVGDESDNYHYVIDMYSGVLVGFHLGWALATTANMSVLTREVIQVGLFDETYKRWGMEDTDLCYRLYLNGARFRINVNALNYHQIHPIGDKWLDYDTRERQNYLMKNLRYFCEKYRNLECYLFLRTWQNKLDLLQANAILIEAAQHSNSVILGELLATYSDLLT